jgi:hypothetical protein
MKIKVFDMLDLIISTISILCDEENGFKDGQSKYSELVEDIPNESDLFDLFNTLLLSDRFINYFKQSNIKINKKIKEKVSQ